MNIVVAQSGGPTCAINASLLGVFRHATKYEEIGTVYGSVNGIEGLIYDNLVNLCDVISDDDDVELIRQTPSTCLALADTSFPNLPQILQFTKPLPQTLKGMILVLFSISAVTTRWTPL